MLKTELLILIICREDVVLHHVWPRVLRHVYVRHVHDPHGGHAAGQPVAPEESMPHVQEAGRGNPPYLPVKSYKFWYILCCQMSKVKVLNNGNFLENGLKEVFCRKEDYIPSFNLC